MTSSVDALDVDDEGLIVLDETPFYAESGGQVGDTGTIVSTVCVSGRLDAENQSTQNTNDAPPANAGGTDSFAIAKVLDTFAPVQGIVLHKSKIEKGTIKVGDTVTATVDVFKRDATRRNHTATHLVHAALKEVLGTHVKQAGSVVAPNYLRFDFTHYQPISDSGIDGDRGFGQPLYFGKSSGQHERNGYRRSDAFGRGCAVRRKIRFGGARACRSAAANFRWNSAAERTSKRRATSARLKSLPTKRLRPACAESARSPALTLLRVSAKTKNLLPKPSKPPKPSATICRSAIEKLQEELKKARRENDELKMKIATGAISTGASNGDEAKEIERRKSHHENRRRFG